MTELTLNGLRINVARLDAVGTATEQRKARVASGGRGAMTGVVSADVLAQTRTDACKCEDENHMVLLGLQPLRAGTPLRGSGGLQGISPEYNFTTEQWEPIPGGKGLESGCTTGRHICPRLDAVRRRYGQ